VRAGAKSNSAGTSRTRAGGTLAPSLATTRQVAGASPARSESAVRNSVQVERRRAVARHLHVIRRGVARRSRLTHHDRAVHPRRDLLYLVAVQIIHEGARAAA
jgi:hypothetical protein